MSGLTLRVKLPVAVTILLGVAFLVISATSSFAQTKGNILVYSTTEPPGQFEYPKEDFDTDLPAILEAHGYTVTVTDRITDPEISVSLLADFDQLWILSTDEDSAGHFSQSEINTILDFRQQGHGLLIMADHTITGQGQYYPSDANQIANLLGVNFFGLENHGDGVPISPQFENHPLFSDVVTIMGHRSEANMTINPPVNLVATYQGDPIIAVMDDGNGRVVFDVTFTRLFDFYTMIGDNPQYVRNIADWLQRSYPVPTMSHWGLIVIILMILIAGVIFIFKQRQISINQL